MLKSFSVEALAAGLLASFVGFASSFAVVLQGLIAVGATQAEAASGLIALSISMGLCAIWLSLKSKLPISVAWSTPGAALLATTGAIEGGFSAAVGAFIVTGVLLLVAGLWKPLGRWVAAIPAPLANAMLAGVILGLCLAPVKAVAELPMLALPIIIVWAVMARINRIYAVPIAVVVTAVIIAVTTDVSTMQMGSLWPEPVLIMPTFPPEAMIGIALPLFIVTMASQNIPGMAVLNANGYRPNPSPLFATTGLFSLFSAPFGGHAVNLAAITASLCASDNAHPDPARRYWAAVVAGVGYVLIGLMAGAATAFIAVAPPILIQAVAGLALLGALGTSLVQALSEARDREAAIVTFLVTASGLAFLGISGAFWGLIAGGAVMGLARWRRGKA